MPATTIESYISESLVESIVEFLGGLPDEYIVRWYPILKLSKRGSEFDNFTEIKMLIRSAADARSTDIIVGIMVHGDYVGMTSGDHDIRIGDVLIGADGRRYQVDSSRLTTTGAKRVVDLSIRDSSDAGDII